MKSNFFKGFVSVAAMLILTQAMLWHELWLDKALVSFSNDGPLGTIASEQAQLPSAFTGLWEDLEFIGKPGLAYSGYGSASMSLLVFTRWPALQLGAMLVLFFYVVWCLVCRVRLADAWHYFWVAMTGLLYGCGLIYLFGGWFGWLDASTSMFQMVFPFLGLWLGVSSIYCVELCDPPRHTLPAAIRCTLAWPSVVNRIAWTLGTPLAFLLLWTLFPNSADRSGGTSGLVVGGVGLLIVGFLLSHITSKTLCAKSLSRST